MDLFSPAKLGRLQLRNRIVMAPMTRSRAGVDAVPTPIMADYYRQRASAGLIVTEGIHDKFVDRLAQDMQALKIDNALKEGTQIGPVVDQSQFDRIHIVALQNPVRLGIDVGRFEARRCRILPATAPPTRQQLLRQ